MDYILSFFQTANKGAASSKAAPIPLLVLSEVSIDDCAGYGIDLRGTGRVGVIIRIFIQIPYLPYRGKYHSVLLVFRPDSGISQRYPFDADDLDLIPCFTGRL